MLFFMYKYIERIVDVESDVKYDFQIISSFLNKGENDYQFLHCYRIQEITMHRESYRNLYRNKANYGAILDALVPCLTGLVPFDKWMCFPKMGHFIASVYDRVFIDLRRYDFSDTIFPLQSKSP